MKPLHVVVLRQNIWGTMESLYISFFRYQICWISIDPLRTKWKQVLEMTEKTPTVQNCTCFCANKIGNMHECFCFPILKYFFGTILHNQISIQFLTNKVWDCKSGICGINANEHSEWYVWVQNKKANHHQQTANWENHLIIYFQIQFNLSALVCLRPSSSSQNNLQRSPSISPSQSIEPRHSQ